MRQLLLILTALAALAEGLWPAAQGAVKAPLPHDWLVLAKTGQKLVEAKPGRSVWASPDGQHRIVLTHVETGLDVECYRVELEGRPLADEALEATFSPDSRFLFIATGPHPVVIDLKTLKPRQLAIESGLENRPVWVHSWSADGLTLVLHQQQRFDDSSHPVRWTVKL